jgi:glycosyltransferase involved in cell wall biosynthesis
MTEAQLARAREATERKRMEQPLQILYVGRLSKPKNVDVLLRAVARATSGGARLVCTVIGGGPELEHLRQLARELGIQERVEFTGAVDYELVLEKLERAHSLVLVSESEGWPKALMEGMAYGLVCIGSSRGLIPQLLGDGRGLVVPPGDVEAVAGHLAAIAADPDTYTSMSRAAAGWAQGFSLERLRDELRALLERAWARPLSEAYRIKG